MLEILEFPKSILMLLFVIGNCFTLNLQLQLELKQSKVDAANAKVNLSIILQQIMDLQQELEESREDAPSAKVNPIHAFQHITDLQQEQQLGLDQQAALAAHLNEPTLEVETAKSGPQALFILLSTVVMRSRPL